MSPTPSSLSSLSAVHLYNVHVMLCMKLSRGRPPNHVMILTSSSSYNRYGILLAVTLLVLILWPSQGLELRWFSQQTQALIAELMQSHSAGGFKAKDEDSEWEMVWDAEGAMHLINKGPKAVPVKVDSTPTSGKR